MKRRVLAFAAAALLLGVPAQAYYHYLTYFRTNLGFPVPAKFDVTRLPNSTVNFYVTDSGPATFSPNDSFGSVLGEIKQALAAWNAVPSSGLRINFGGLQAPNQNANTAGGKVVFQNLAPGVLGMGTPQVSGTPNIQGNTFGTFIPITQSLVILTNNTSQVPGPSYMESFFTTAVHEIGHALGLQHTWTGAAMSQGVIRNTSRARPIDADDIAGLSVLYGNNGWTSNFGAITGRVSFADSTGVSMASVVAIPVNGPAVSTLTNPDGTYTLNGLPPNSYQLYVHPLPPDAIVANGEGLQLPQDQTGRPIAASGSFFTQFYGGTNDPAQSQAITVNAGTNLQQYNFTVQQRSGVPAYDLVTYSYLDPAAHAYPSAPNTCPACVLETPAYLDATQSQAFVAVQANSGATVLPQSVTMLGIGQAFFNQLYANNQYDGLYFALPGGLSSGPRHLVFRYGSGANSDIYVLPEAVNLAQSGPPYVSNVSANGDGTVTVSGTGLGPDTRVFFDGLQAAATFTNGSLTATPPPGLGGQTSAITVFNSDGQNSIFLQALNPPQYTYPAGSTGQILNVSPSSLPAGSTAMVDITANNGQFADGQVSVGFGTNDVVVNKVYRVNANHLIANVTVAGAPQSGSSEISVINGFQVMQAGNWSTQGGAFAALAAPQVLALVNGAAPAATSLNPGGFGVVYGFNVGAGIANTQVTINGTPAAVVFAGATQVNFAVPGGLPVGPAALTLTTPAGSVSYATVVAAVPPTIQSINGPNGALDATHFANAGDVITVNVTGLDPSAANNLSRVQVAVAGIAMPVSQITQSGGNTYQVQFSMQQSFGGSQVPVTVLVDGASNGSYTISAR